MATVIFQGPPFSKVGGSLGPNSIILDPSLGEGEVKRVMLRNVIVKKIVK